MGEVIGLDALREGKCPQVICYPKYDLEELEMRLKEMRTLNVNAVEFSGESKILDLPVLGKGYVGVVVLAYTEFGKVALKIRRTDADRSGMTHEAEMLQAANSVDVGPQLLDHTENFLVMEFVDGTLIPKWIRKVWEVRDADRIRKVLRDVMEECWRLDELGLDHGELSRASKHIKINPEDRAYILDFETASLNRRTSNVTSVCQYLFMRSEVAQTVKMSLVEVREENLINALRAYKKVRSREKFEEILKICRL